MHEPTRPSGASRRSWSGPWPRSCQELLLPLHGIRALRGARFLQRLDLLGRVAGLCEHLSRVLAQRGRRPVDARGRAGELDRESELPDRSELGLLIADGHLALADEL